MVVRLIKGIDELVSIIEVKSYIDNIQVSIKPTVRMVYMFL